MKRGILGAPMWAVIVIVVGAVWLVAGTAYAAMHKPAEPLSHAEINRLDAAAASASAADAAARPVGIVIVGDSYSAGSDIGGYGASGWPALAATQMRAGRYNLQMDLTAVGGTGYTNGEATGTDFAQQMTKTQLPGCDLVVFFGSRNDQTGTDAVAAGASDAYAAAHKVCPGARLLVIGPPWVNAAPPSWLLAARDGVKQAAAKAGVTFVDPVAQGWFTGPNGSLIGSDGVHPTDAGHRYLAGLIAPLIEQQLDTIPRVRTYRAAH